MLHFRYETLCIYSICPYHYCPVAPSDHPERYDKRSEGDGNKSQKVHRLKVTGHVNVDIFRERSLPSCLGFVVVGSIATALAAALITASAAEAGRGVLIVLIDLVENRSWDDSGTIISDT